MYVCFFLHVLPASDCVCAPAPSPVPRGAAGADVAETHRVPVAVETGSGNRQRDAACVRRALGLRKQGATVPAAPLHLQRARERERERERNEQRFFFCLKASLTYRSEGLLIYGYKIPLLFRPSFLPLAFFFPKVILRPQGKPPPPTFPHLFPHHVAHSTRRQRENANCLLFTLSVPHTHRLPGHTSAD